MRKITVFTLLSASIMLALYSCHKEQVLQSETNTDVNLEKIRQDAENTLLEIQKESGNTSLDERSHCDGRVVVLAAGSHNALKNAIAQAGEGGLVYLRSGTHTENEGVTITHRTNIVGERGSVLKFKSALAPFNGTSIDLSPSIHLLNASSSSFLNLDIQTQSEDGSTAILLENAHNTIVFSTKISKFQYSIMAEKSDRLIISKNTVEGTSAWQTREDIGAFGITIINGKSSEIKGNTVTNFFFGIWPCDANHISQNNTMSKNFIGHMLCNVPKAYKLPSGSIIGANTPSTYCKVLNNNSTDNFNAGYLVIDGANNNLLRGNRSSGNGTYDIELVGDSERFGFFTPRSYSNTVYAMPTQKVKNCGDNNTVVGGVMVNTATDPCK